jgi:two-component system, chemotaxis family, sensor kinase CheA
MSGKRLQRQLKSVFGDEKIVDRLRSLASSVAGKNDPNAIEELRTFIENFPAFLQSVDMYYDQFEDRAALAQQSIDLSSQELSIHNARYTNLNRLFETIVNSLGQGFLIFDRDGFCLSTYSKACESLLGCSPAGLHVSEALRVPVEKRETFLDWIRLLFQDMIDFEDLVDVGPKLFPNTDQKVVTLEYKPVRTAEGRLEMVVVIATDRTLETSARQQAHKMQAFATLMASILKDKERFKRFVAATRQILSDVYRAINATEFDHEILAEVKRNLHTLKGAAAAFGVIQVSDEINHLETKLSDESDLKRLKYILSSSIPAIDNSFEGMLDEYREILAEILVDREPSRIIPIDTLELYAKKIRKLGPEGQKLYTDFMDEVVKVPLHRIFADFDEVLQTSAKKLNKKVEPLQIVGDEISVFPESIDAFRASLIHVFRNIVDHGIENEMVREQRGKPAAGRIICEFRAMARSGGNFLRIIINDDGNGVDVYRVRMRLEKTGQESEGLSNKQLINKIFDAGFTTASAVTEFSGRGVGLDAVKYEVERLGGTIDVRSDIGRGTAFIIELPLDESGNFFVVRNSTGAA